MQIPVDSDPHPSPGDAPRPAVEHHSAPAAARPSGPVRVLVVIPTLNEVHTVAGVIEQLASGLPAHLDVRFAVVDGGSTDGTLEVVRRLAQQQSRLSLLFNDRRLQSAAVNLAVRALGRSAAVLVRCDAHAAYPPNYIGRLVETLEREGTDAVVVPMDSVGRGCLQKAVAWLSNTALGSGGAAHRAGTRSGLVDHGHHAAFRMRSFLRAGGYDEGYSHNEDAEFDCRQRALGSRVYLDAGIRVAYEPRASLGSLARQYFAYGRGRSRTLRRHPASIRARQLAAPLHVLACMLSLAISPWLPEALIWPGLYGALLGAAAIGLALRHRSACALWAAPVGAVMHFAWGLGFLHGCLTLREARWRPDGAGSAGTAAALRVRLVDPSLFTAPYNAALTEGLLAAGVQPRWATRPLRPGDAPEIAPAHVDPFFYRRTDRASRLPAPLRALAKGCAHALGLLALLRRVRRERPDVVHWQWVVVPPLDVLALLLVRRLCPVVMTVHDTVPFNGQRLSLLQRIGFDLPLRLADGLIVHTRAGRQALVERGVPALKIRVVRHGPLRLRCAPRPQPGARDARWTFVMFGEIKPYKGVDLMVEAVGRLHPAQRARMRVIVAGRPRMKLDAIHARIDALALRDTVTLDARRLGEQEMADLFDSADSFVFPYRQVDASGVYFLVKPLGKWLVASRVGVFAEDLQPGVQGALLPAGDVDALAAELERCIVERPAAQPVAVAPSWNEIGAATRREYERCIAATGHSRRAAAPQT